LFTKLPATHSDGALDKSHIPCICSIFTGFIYIANPAAYCKLRTEKILRHSGKLAFIFFSEEYLAPSLQCVVKKQAASASAIHMDALQCWLLKAITISNH
jgi:hypothetical protein